MKNRSIKQFYKKLLNERKKFLIQEEELDTSSVDTQIDRYLQNYERESQKKQDQEGQEAQDNRGSEERQASQGNPEQRESTQRTLKNHFRMLFEDEADELIDKILKGKGKSEEGDEEPDENVPAAEAPPEGAGNQEQLPQDVDINAVGQDSQPPEGGEAQAPDEDDSAMPMGGGMGPTGGEEQPTDGQEMQDEENPEDTSIPERAGQLDISNYVSRISNFVENAQNLLDIKSVILHRALDIVKKNYGDEDAKKFAKLLKSEYKDNAPDDDEVTS